MLKGKTMGILNYVKALHDSGATYNPGPASFAKLYVYRKGSEALAALYEDQDLTDTIANPLVTDENGSFPVSFVRAGQYVLRAVSDNGTPLAPDIEYTVSAQPTLGLAGSYATVQALLLDDAMSYTAEPGKYFVDVGALVQVADQDATYRVLPADATDADLVTNSGIKIKLSPRNGVLPLTALGTVTTASLQAAVDTFEHVSINTSMTLTSEIEVPDDRTVSIRKGVTITLDGVNGFVPLGNFTMYNEGTFIGPDTRSVIRARVAQTRALYVDNFGTCIDCKFLSMDYDGLNYDTINSPTDLIGPVYIRNPRGVCTTGSSNGPLIRLAYCFDCTIKGGSARGYRHGISAWGGDSNFTGDGVDFDAERKCKNLVIDGFTAYDLASTHGNSGGGVWGSMVDGFRVIGCTLENGEDVGIDFEGCFNAIATGNIVRDFKNGNFTTFFGCRDVRFESNISEQVMGRPTYRTYNSSNNPSRQTNITFANNTCSAHDDGSSATAYSSIDAGNGTIDGYFQFGNTLRNIVTHRVNSSGASGETYLADDSYSFDVAVASAFDCITAGKVSQGMLTIKGNRFRPMVPLPAGSRMIYVTSSDYNRDLPVFIIDNCEAMTQASQFFDLGIQVVETGGNIGRSCRVYVQGNRATALSLLNNGARDIQVLLNRDNFSGNGSPL